MTNQGVVIVGAGEAGGRLALALRAKGFAEPITLIGEEPHAPHERPPLSKNALFDEAPPRPTTIADAEQFCSLDIALRLGERVEAIDRTERRLRLFGGETLGYDRLALATGARARRLPVPGAQRALTLRRFEDAVALRERIRASARVAVVGAGFIGLEIAAGARKLGADVVVLEAAPRALARACPAPLAEALIARHRAEGVEMRFGANVAAFHPNAVELADGERVDADLIVVGVGAAPDVDLAAAAGLAIDNGVMVDARLTTSDPRIFALGDCANFPHPLFEGRRLRLESWRNALDQAEFLAGALTGAGGDFGAVPWFWSDQYDLTLQIAGLAHIGGVDATRDVGDGALMTFHLAADGRLIGAGAVGPLGKVAREIRVAEMLIAKRATPAAEALSSPKVKLKSLL